MTRRSLAAVALVAAAGCARVAPGLHLSEGAVESRAGAAGPVRIAEITPALLRAQAEEDARARGARPRDPAGPSDASYEYRIAPRDVLAVTVWEHPELTLPSGEYRAADLAGNPVQADGTVFYPHAGVVPVVGKTVAEVRTLLTEKLRKWIESPQLDVRVVGFRGKRVQVTGEVGAPSTLPVTDVPLRVHDAIAQAKGLTPDAWTRDVLLSRAGTVHHVDLQALYDEGDVSQNWLLEDGDVLHVPTRQQKKVFVMGEVRMPSSKLMARGRMSLAEAIGDAAGFDPITSNTAGVYVIRGPYDAPHVFKLDASSADALLLATQFELAPLDVVFVSPHALTDLNRVVTQLLPAVQGLWQAADLANRAVQVIP